MKRLLAVCAAAFVLAACSKSGTKASSGGTSSGTTAGSAATSSGGSSATTTGTSGTSATTTTGSTTSSGSSTTGTNCPASFSVAPASQSVNLTGGTAAPITFTVQDGSGNAVDPSGFTWTVTRADDTDPGTITNGVYQPNPNAGGTVTVTATGCGSSSSAQVEFHLDFQGASTLPDGGPLGIGAGDFGGTFTGPFPDGGAAGPNAPKIYYPSAETRFPRNIYKVLFQWSRQNNTLFRLTFTGANSTVTVYTDGNDPQCAAIAATVGCWQADTATWTAIASSNAGSTVSFEVDGTPSSGGNVFASAVETLGFSRRDVAGAIFYWAADVGGVQRATVSDAEPENYLVGPQKVPPSPLPNGDTVACAACHSVSRDGKVMAVSGSATGSVSVPKGVWTFHVTPAPPPGPIQLDFASPAGDSFASISPDDSQLIFSPRNGGPLLVLDVDAGTIVAPVLADGGAVKGIAPDWSPRTDVAEFAYADLAGNIASLQWDGASFSQPRIVAGLIGGKKNAYPRYASEGDWIAYTSNNSRIFVVPSDGGASVELVAANDVVNNAVVAPSENSMPTWAPPGDLRWVAFNSQRPYGKVTNGGNNQIWVAAVDFSRLDGGLLDPSYPAFRLPFQALDAKNHRAFWVQDVRAGLDAGPYIPPDAGPYIPPDAGSCVATGDACDPGSSACCDQPVTGAFCGAVDGGTSACQVPLFQ